ncbi:TPA: MATE family efflux transporter [Streptococcus suis]|uniref:MATE family efflux transporter n=1 Tax=Streptococcus suis TaxID=1307 RepID=UPI0004247FBC|nr:MATE family efflux transporter [Streptococcus suis]MBY4985583.1 MATE family efflux transporter [Streptococcus suis]MBY5038764.1 MATE family efflux transporter [Streptococcus suis]HEM6112374.1 MATE family efflux transporter [Streptococcus suis]HEM6266020.1 MATE family efflux transporter [Streptococcus suis]HEM6320211.1 MATE family efflux transporter [Streptococcus suis]
MNNQRKEILRIALPAMAENILQMLMGMVDSYLVASLGLVALSGVSLANNILAVYQAIFIALAAAISSRMAQMLGQGKTEKVGYLASESLKVTLFVSLVLGALAVLAGPFLLTGLGAEAAVAKAGGLYLILVGGGIFFLGLMMSLGAMLRALGQPRFPMYISLLSNILNALFSAFAVFVLHAGVAGVAFGTVLSRLIGCFLLWAKLSIPFEKWTWSWDIELIRLALPATGERLMMRAGDVVVVALITSLGTVVVAGNAIGETLTQFNYMPAMGIATATIILTAKHRQNQSAVEDILKRSFFLSLIFMLLVAVTTYLSGPLLIGLYSKEPQVVQASQTVLLYSMLGVPFTASTLVLTALWQGLGNAKLPFYATSLGMWIVRIGLAYLLIGVFHLGLQAIWIATIADNAFRAGCLYCTYMRKR